MVLLVPLNLLVFGVGPVKLEFEVPVVYDELVALVVKVM
jgi:hypothetical protein